MINRNWKILTGTTLGVLMSTVAIAPASAEYVAQHLQPQDSMEQRESMGSRETKVGQIQEISGSTVTVMMKDGMSKDIETSPNTLTQMNLSQGSYVLVSNDAIIGAAERGTIRSVTNEVAEIEMDNGDVKTFNIGQELAANTEIVAGADVFVANNEIVASAEGMDDEMMDNSSDRDSSGSMETERSQTETETEGTSGTYESQPTTDTGTQSPSSGGTYNSQPSTGTYESQPSTGTQTEDSSETYESQPDTTDETQTEETEEPVRGMW
jgi:hypothetical protein